MQWRRRPLAVAVLAAAAAGTSVAAVVTMHHAVLVAASAPGARTAPSGAPGASVPAPLRVVVLGDSVVSGTACACTPFGPRLEQMLRQQPTRQVDLVSLGQDGLTSTGLVTQLEHDGASRAAVRRATTVTVTIGANDFDASDADDGCGGSGTGCYDGPLRTMAAGVGTTIRLVRGLAGPRVHVYVTGYWNVFLDGAVGATHGPTYQRTSDALTRLVNARIAAAAAAAGATYVDLYRPFGVDDTALLAPDGDHPNAAGHQLIAQVLATAIKRE